MRRLLPLVLAACARSTAVAPPNVATVSCVEPRFDLPAKIAIHCWPSAPCHDSFEVVLDNCTDQPLTVSTLLFGPKGSPSSIDYDTPVLVGPRDRRGFQIPPSGTVWDLGTGRWQIVARAKVAGVEKTIQASFELYDPARDAARTKCVQRGDDWENDACAEVMPDHDAPCSDERDCKGECWLVSYTPVPPDKKRANGVCSRHRKDLGCRTVVGKTDGGLIPANVTFPRICP